MSGIEVYVDGGGTRTRVAIVRGGSAYRYEFGSVNPTVGVGADSNVAKLLALLSGMTWQDGAATDGAIRCVIASSSIGPSTIENESGRWKGWMSTIRASFDVLLVNDVVPLVAQPSAGHPQIAMVFGTGSCFLHQRSSVFTRIGGQEWLASDEGGATHLGLLALRNLARAADGRIPWTNFHSALVHALEGDSPAAAMRAISEQAHPKSSLASLAPIALEWSYTRRDDSARQVVSAALSDVDENLLHLAKLDWVTATCRIAGGLLASAGYREEIESRVQALLCPRETVHVIDTLSSARTVDWDLASAAEGYVTRIQTSNSRGLL